MCLFGNNNVGGVGGENWIWILIIIVILFCCCDNGNGNVGGIGNNCCCD